MFRLKEPLSGWIGLILLAAAASLTGCASSPSSPKLDLNNPNPNHANEVFKAERIHLEKRPKIGLALSGGGTKAAVFAHGVLHGLNDAGVLKNVDVISSVSGGSYAAMWYFTKHIEAKSNSFDINQIFKDCWTAWRINPTTDSEKPDWNQYKHLFAVAEAVEEDSCFNSTHYRVGDPYRFQAHLLRYPDLFRTEYTVIDGNKQKAPVKETLGLLANVVTELFVGWAGIDTGLVDSYQAGIERTWGLNPKPRSEQGGATESKDAWSYSNDNRDTGVKYRPRMDPSKATFSQLRDLYKGANPPPMWVLQATIGNKGRLPDMDTLYEMSPFVQGSNREDSKWTSDPQHFQSEIQQIPTAVRASAAFADSQGVEPGLLKTLMLGITNNLLPSSRWGVDITLKNGRSARLSDGGGSDNLGLMSLVRRQLDDIIIADSAEDKAGTMDDLCWAKKTLELEKLVMEIDNLEDFDKICEYRFDRSDASKSLAYNVSMWVNPVVTGRISSKFTNRVTRLWIIKPAWNQQEMRSTYNDLTSICGPTPPRIPCGLLLYYANNTTVKTPQGDYMTFPQDGTVSAVLNSSSYKTLAYRELGRFNAGHLRLIDGALSVTTKPREQPSHPNKKVRPGPGLFD
jgi:hypothetical protein